MLIFPLSIHSSFLGRDGISLHLLSTCSKCFESFNFKSPSCTHVFILCSCTGCALSTQNVWSSADFALKVNFSLKHDSYMLFEKTTFTFMSSDSHRHIDCVSSSSTKETESFCFSLSPSLHPHISFSLNPLHPWSGASYSLNCDDGPLKQYQDKWKHVICVRWTQALTVCMNIPIVFHYLSSNFFVSSFLAVWVHRDWFWLTLSCIFHVLFLLYLVVLCLGQPKSLVDSNVDIPIVLHIFFPYFS